MDILIETFQLLEEGALSESEAKATFFFLMEDELNLTDKEQIDFWFMLYKDDYRFSQE
jgi:hypothetical protein